MNNSSTSNERASAYPAHLGWRLLSMTYDALPMIPLLLICSALALLLRGGNPITPGSAVEYLEFVLLWLINWSVVGTYAVVSWRRGGQTIGMRPWRLLVVNQEGKNASLKSLWLRFAIVSLSGGLALLWCLVDPQKRGLHDIASGTLMVRKQAISNDGKARSSSPSA